MANPANPKPLAAILLALVLTALCFASDERKTAERALHYGSPVFSPLAETSATVEP